MRSQGLGRVPKKVGRQAGRQKHIQRERERERGREREREREIRREKARARERITPCLTLHVVIFGDGVQECHHIIILALVDALIVKEVCQVLLQKIHTLLRGITM
jgi:hypothetical protein